MASSFPSKYIKATRRILCLLDQCLTINQVKQVQSHLTVSGALRDPYAAGKIIASCSALDDVSHADQLFLRTPFKTTFIWNTMIQAYAEKDDPFRAIFLHKRMIQSGFLPNNYTFSFVLRACTKVSDLQLGLVCHAKVVKLGWESHDFVQNGLMHLYVTCSEIAMARKLFNTSVNRDAVTWTALICGYLKHGWVAAARELFDKMPEKSAISWSAMITGYVQVGLYREALKVFRNMHGAKFQPNHAGIVGALTACAFIGCLEHGRQIHGYFYKTRMELNAVLGTALIDMYAKCGCIDTACRVFNKIPVRDVFAFTSLISGLANNDRTASVIELFVRMKNEGIVPNEVTFICVLSACSRMGLVDKGLKIFESMSGTYGMKPGVQHYGCLVNLLGRAGMLEDAKKVVEEMPIKPDSYVLGALLDACRVHGDVKLAKQILDDLEKQQVDHSGKYVLLSNVYASANQWDDVAKIRKGMEEKKVKKVPGSSMIGINGVV